MIEGGQRVAGRVTVSLGGLHRGGRRTENVRAKLVARNCGQPFDLQHLLSRHPPTSSPVSHDTGIANAQRRGSLGHTTKGLNSKING